MSLMKTAKLINLNPSGLQRLEMMNDYRTRRQRVQRNVRGLLRSLVEHLYYLEKQLKETSLVPPEATIALAMFADPGEPLDETCSESRCFLACQECVARMALVNGAVHAVGGEAKFRHHALARMAIRDMDRMYSVVEIIHRIAPMSVKTGEWN